MIRKTRLAILIYSLICDIPVSFFLCLTATLIANTKIFGGDLFIYFSQINWKDFGINYSVSITLALSISNFIPLTTIGRWFTALFKVDNKTYTGNMPYRLLATLVISLIFYAVITPSLSVFNCFIYPVLKGENALTFKEFLINFSINTPFMLLMGYITSLIFDIPAYRIARKVEPNL